MEKDTEDQFLYEPSDKKRKTINKVYDRLYRMMYTRDRDFGYFNDRNLLDTLDDWTKRWNGYVAPRDIGTMDWQSRVFNNFTRNQVISFLSRVALKMPKSRFVATNKEGYEDTMRAHIIEKMYTYTKNRENGEKKFADTAMECTVKGTVVGYEGFKKIKRKIKEVTKYDATTGEVEYTEKEILDYNDCYQEIIPLEDFYVGNIWERDMNMQPDVVWKTIMVKSRAKEEFGKYPDWKYVKDGPYTVLSEQVSFYKDKNYSELESNQVEIIRYYNRLKDWMVYIANGVVLYDGPLPFAHKCYPFVSTIFEPFAIDFFYGKSLPGKIENDQDQINTSWNMMNDQWHLSIHKPILTDDEDPLDTTVLIPGLIQSVGDRNAYRVLDELQGPDSSSFQMLNTAMKFAQDNAGSLGGGATAQSGGGGKVTARQAMMKEEQAKQGLGFSARFLENFDHDAAVLRAKNILQFYTIPEKNEAISGTKDADWKKMFMRVIRIDDTELSDGTYGTTIIKMARDKKSMPSQEDVDVEAEMARRQGQNVEIHVIDPDYIRNIEFDVQVVNESSFTQSKSLEQAVGTEFYQIALQDQNINQLENTREWVKLNDKDPDKFIKEMTPTPEGMPGMPPQPGQLPEGMQPPQTPAPQGGAGMSSQIAGKGQAKSLTQVMQ